MGRGEDTFKRLINIALFRLERKVRWMLWSPMMLEMERLVVLDEVVFIQHRVSAGKLNVILSQPGVLHGRRCPGNGGERGKQWKGKKTSMQ